LALTVTIPDTFPGAGAVRLTLGGVVSGVGVGEEGGFGGGELVSGVLVLVSSDVQPTTATVTLKINIAGNILAALQRRFVSMRFMPLLLQAMAQRIFNTGPCKVPAPLVIKLRPPVKEVRVQL